MLNINHSNLNGKKKIQKVTKPVVITSSKEKRQLILLILQFFTSPLINKVYFSSPRRRITFDREEK